VEGIPLLKQEPLPCPVHKPPILLSTTKNSNTGKNSTAAAYLLWLT